MKLLLVLCGLILANLLPVKAPVEFPVSAHVLFSPRGGCTKAVVDEIGKAKKSVHVLAYSFTSLPIADALIAAQKRNVTVSVVLDWRAARGRSSVLSYLKARNVMVYLDRQHAIAHNKVILIDEETTFTGSFNWTNDAEQSNAENLLVLRGKELTTIYLENWRLHQSHSFAPLP